MIKPEHLRKKNNYGERKLHRFYSLKDINIITRRVITYNVGKDRKVQKGPLHWYVKKCGNCCKRMNVVEIIDIWRHN